MISRKPILSGSIKFILLIAFTYSALSADWPRWRGPSNNGHSAESLDSLPQSPVTLWKLPLGTGFSSPVAADSTVVILDAADDREVVRALSAKDGGELWSADLDATFGDTQGPEGPRNTPVIDGDRVYAVSCRGELKCLSLSDGRLIWRVNFVEDLGAEFIGEKGTAQGAVRHGNDGSPLVDGPHLIVPAGGTNGHSVVCFDKLTGDVVWHSQNDVAGYGSPVVADIAGVKQVVVFTVDGTIGLRRDNGQLLWRVPMETTYGRHVMTPVVWRDIVVVGSHTAGLTGIRVTRKGDGFVAENAWINKEAAPNFSHPVARDRFLFGLGPQKLIVCVDMETGELQWSESGNIITSASRPIRDSSMPAETFFNSPMRVN